MKIENIPDATPLDPDELLELIPSHITTQGELNEWEQANILSAQQWLPNVKNNSLSEIFLKNLHLKMFDKTWRWAGEYRRTNKNIGVDWIEIPIHLKLLIDDIYYYIENNTYEKKEIAVRFHHRLVAIHLFPNGNGRHARMVTDQLLKSFKLPQFTWGRTNLGEANDVRERYISALRAADRHDYHPLLEFVS